MERIRKHPAAAVEIGVADYIQIRSRKRLDETNIEKRWFPMTYVYDSDEYRGLLATYSKRLAFKEHLEEMMFVLNFESIDEFKEQYKNVEEKFPKGDI